MAESGVRREKARVFFRDRVFYFKRWYHRVIKKEATVEVEPHD